MQSMKDLAKKHMLQASLLSRIGTTRALLSLQLRRLNLTAHKHTTSKMQRAKVKRAVLPTTRVETYKYLY